MNNQRSNDQHDVDERVLKPKTTKSTVVRYIALGLHFVLDMGLFLTAFFVTPSDIMISILAFACFGMLVYVPATIILTAKRKITKWDRAWGEIVYLSYQAVLMLANAITAGIVGGPSYCSERLYNSGKVNSNSKFSYEPISSIQALCNGFSSEIALSTIHFVALLVWIYWIYRVTTRNLSLSKSGLGYYSSGSKNLWNVSVGELMRRNAKKSTYSNDKNGSRRLNGDNDDEEENGITPFIIPPQNQSQINNLERINNSTEHRQTSLEPERDAGAYIPPPPYQNSYSNDNDNFSSSPTTSNGNNNSPVEITSVSPNANSMPISLNQPIHPSNGYSNSQLQHFGGNSSNSTRNNNRYLPEIDLGADNLTSSSPLLSDDNDEEQRRRNDSLRRLVNEKQAEEQRRSAARRMLDEKQASRNQQEEQNRPDLRRVLDEKQDSKDVVRRALGG